jgi:hypothetical protein
MNDLTPPVDKPISVNESALPDQAGAAIRTLLVAVGGYMAGKGWIDANIVAALVPVIMIVGPLVWGQLRVLRTHAERVTMADAAPSTVANVARTSDNA